MKNFCPKGIGYATRAEVLMDVRKIRQAAVSPDDPRSAAMSGPCSVCNQHHVYVPSPEEHLRRRRTRAARRARRQAA